MSRSPRLALCRPTLCLSWLIAGTATQVVAQPILTGVVRQDSSGRRMAGVEVLIDGAGPKSVSDASGRYVLTGLRAGRYVALFRSVGYFPVRQQLLLSGGDTTWVNVTLIPVGAARLAPIVVTAPPPGPRGLGVEGFEERRRMGFGDFIDSTELRRLEHVHLPDVIRRHSPIRFRNVAIAPGIFVTYAVSNRYRCYMQVIVDGVVWFKGSHEIGEYGTRAAPPDLEREFPVASLAAVEIYRGPAGTPIEFGGTDAGCGTVVLWTKR